MTQYKNYSLSKYLDCLSSKDPAPGGGSAAALVSATGASLVSMVARYSLGPKQSKSVRLKIKTILNKSEKLRQRLLVLVDLDAEAYLQVVKARKGTLAQKKKANKKACDIPLEICRLSYAAVQLTPFLAEKGNPYLLSDVTCAVEMLLAGFQSAMANVEANQ
ncbi:MAG: cyclodeaminase/cyclohydrolase family protein [Candidatus Omnitrophica bacterium]|nr:cyclodeaminase/cyclohydrolase family protein [Candidatus Omnitrophota bacterium]